MIKNLSGSEPPSSKSFLELRLGKRSCFLPGASHQGGVSL